MASRPSILIGSSRSILVHTCNYNSSIFVPNNGNINKYKSKSLFERDDQCIHVGVEEEITGKLASDKR